ncbi:hypothetical protein [Octadecabacter ascidiaceicola]|uniref:Uncharacterized protein n=1 Tax=Octadecabacter ascidiaceicola TaxID=1655543 RepID=A0A238KBP7_9RHOB|nr:hypothetical protein [Octadecabacter ascidiaceicola]SMX40215.1 hypothetical protein OCA8868_02319 [Octadecabacter ascidiaceicola]
MNEDRELSELRLNDERDMKSFGQLVELAESVQKDLEAMKRTRFLTTVLAVSMSFTIAAFAPFLVGRSPNDFYGLTAVQGFNLTTVPLAMGFVFASGVVARWFYETRIERESRAYRSVMLIVHEVFSASKTEMSVLEIANYEIRVSRLR